MHDLRRKKKTFREDTWIDLDTNRKKSFGPSLKNQGVTLQSEFNSLREWSSDGFLANTLMNFRIT
jgi:hypothetical protein